MTVTKKFVRKLSKRSKISQHRLLLSLKNVYLGISRGPNVVVRSGSARWAGRVLAGAGLQVSLSQVLERVMAFVEETWCNRGQDSRFTSW